MKIVVKELSPAPPPPPLPPLRWYSSILRVMRQRLLIR